MFNNGYEYGIYDTFRDALKESGTELTVWWRRSTASPSTSTTDPVYGTIMDYSYSGDDGSKRIWYSTPKNITGILYKFAKGFKNIEDGRLAHKVAGFGDARFTCWMDDALVNLHSVSGPSYFTNVHTVESYGTKYTVRNTERVGIGQEMILIVTLNKIE
jgi:hypothetical protein